MYTSLFHIIPSFWFGLANVALSSWNFFFLYLSPWWVLLQSWESQYNINLGFGSQGFLERCTFLVLSLMPSSTSCSFLSMVIVEGLIDGSGGFYPGRNTTNRFSISDFLLTGGGGVAANVTFFCCYIAPAMVIRASSSSEFLVTRFVISYCSSSSFLLVTALLTISPCARVFWSSIYYISLAMEWLQRFS